MANGGQQAFRNLMKSKIETRVLQAKRDRKRDLQDVVFRRCRAIGRPKAPMRSAQKQLETDQYFATTGPANL
jgi:hypothetical protein